MAEETPVSEANLLSLPPEILTEIVALCGRSPRHPRATPAALMSSCRDLYELGQAASTRIAFLVAVFGTLRAIEGSCGWLPLLRRDVLDGLFRRVQGASHPVPRYQLQRLFQRCTNASRTDLLFRILAFTEELYPPPSAKTFSAKHRSGVAEYAETSLGFHVRFTDDCLFIELAFAEPDATGSEAHDRQWAYLVEEGRQAGWEVKDDRPMTALLTLKRKYGLDPNLTVCGLSRNTAALLLKEEDVDRFHDDPLPTFPADCGVEGLSLGYCALIKAIEIEDVQALRRLLSMGVSVVGEDDSFFWQAIRVAREGIVAENATPEEKRLLAHEATGRVLRDLGFNLNAPVVCDDYLRICELLDETYQVNQEFGLSNGRDVLEHFALTGDGTEEVLRTVLSFLEESGWLATPAGRRAITNATSICLERNRIDFYEVFHSFSSRFEETNDGNLLVQLLRGDVDGAQVLAAHGQRLTPQQIVGRVSVFADSNRTNLNGTLVYYFTADDINQLQKRFSGNTRVCAQVVSIRSCHT